MSCSDFENALLARQTIRTPEAGVKTSERHQVYLMIGTDRMPISIGYIARHEAGMLPVFHQWDYLLTDATSSKKLLQISHYGID